MNTDQLQALLEEATPLPWERGTGSRLTVWAGRHCIFEDSFRYARLADADLIVAVVNALPEILSSLGSDETGAKPADGVRDRVVAPSSASTDSSQSREARHGVAQALVDKVRLELHHTGFAMPDDGPNPDCLGCAADQALDSLLGLIDELSDRLYSATAQLSKEAQ